MLRFESKRAVLAGNVFLAAAVVVFVGYSWRLAERQVAPRLARVGDPPDDLKAVSCNVTFRTADGIKLSGWFVRPPAASTAVILLHGYRGDRRAMLGRARWLAKQGVAVLLYDARGHGESAGERISFGYDEAADLVAAAEWLGAEGIDQFFAIGFSQGAVTIIMAADLLPGLRGAVLESAFDTFEHSHDRAFRHRVGLPGWLAGCVFIPATERLLGFPMQAFRPIDHLDELRCPVLIIGGSRDPYTWESDTEALFSAARPPKQLWVVRGAGHEDFLAFDVKAYTDRVGAFLHANGIHRN